MNIKLKKPLKIIVSVIAGFALVGILISTYVLFSTISSIKAVDELEDDYDCVLVLGAGLWSGKPSPMLEDRLKVGIEIYEELGGITMVMSGDNEKKDYDEPTAMMVYAMENGVNHYDIVKDRFGLSTYESLYRAKYVYNMEKVIIVTQRYHLHRALYIARALGLEAVGVKGDLRNYGIKMIKYTIREWLARDKDFVYSIIKPKAKYMNR